MRIQKLIIGLMRKRRAGERTKSLSERKDTRFEYPGYIIIHHLGTTAQILFYVKRLKSKSFYEGV